MERKDINGTEYINLSGRSFGQAKNWLPPHLQAEKVALLPDLGPTKGALLPTGSHVVINTDAQPSWRELTLSDIGCGMRVVELVETSFSDFVGNLDAWDQLQRRIKANKGKLGDLGGGNHFMDAVVDAESDDGKVHIVTHTGSRNESPLAADLVAKPRAFDKKYPEIVNWARQNRDALTHEVEKLYGRTKLVSDKPHNFFERQDNNVLIYKGSMTLKPGEVGVIPSSMTGDMVLVEGTEAGQEINFAMSHGTGRKRSRSDSKLEGRSYDFKRLRQEVYIPEAIPNESLTTDYPECYGDLDTTLQLLEGLIKVVRRFTPIAYLGQF